jgi:hypothetical protein
MVSATGTLRASSASAECDHVPVQQLTQEFFGRRREKFPGDFDTGDLGGYMIWTDDSTVGTAMNPLYTVIDQGEREIQIGRSADAANGVLQVQIDRGRFQIGFVGAVNKIEAEGKIGHPLPQLHDRGFDVFQSQTGGAEKTDHAGPSRGLHHFDRGDAVGHGANDVWIAQPKGMLEIRITQIFRMQRRYVPQHGVAVGRPADVRSGGVDRHTSAAADCRLPVDVDNARRFGNASNRRADGIGADLRRPILGAPPTDRAGG